MTRTSHGQSGWSTASSIACMTPLALATRLLVLVGGLRVGDGAAAGLHVGDAVLDHDRADVDAGVEVAGVGQPADRAAVAAALDRLELVDDLHRADLRRARERAGGQGGAQRVHRADVGAQRAGHRGDDVHDVAVGLDGHERLDLDGAVLADAAEVVAAEVDEHHVLGALLLVREQLAGDALRPPRRSAPRGRVPAIGRVETRRPETVSSGSGLAPAIWKSSKSRKYMYGLGLTVRRPR